MRYTAQYIKRLYSKIASLNYSGTALIFLAFLAMTLVAGSIAELSFRAEKASELENELAASAARNNPITHTRTRTPTPQEQSPSHDNNAYWRRCPDLHPEKKLALLRAFSRYGGSIDDRNIIFSKGCTKRMAFVHTHNQDASILTNMIITLYYLTTITSEFSLVFMTIVLSAVLGACASRIREAKSFDLRIIFLGTIAGFLSSLLLQSGFVTLHGTSEQARIDTINPYAAAFIGATSGLFTSKFFFAINAITDNVLERITKTFE